MGCLEAVDFAYVEGFTSLTGAVHIMDWAGTPSWFILPASQAQKSVVRTSPEPPSAARLEESAPVMGQTRHYPPLGTPRVCPSQPMH